MSAPNKPGTFALAQAAQLAAQVNQMVAMGADRGDDTRRMDADEVAMLALSLEQMRARTYEVDYPELKSRLILPVATDIDTAAETFAYEVQDYVGRARVVRNYAKDFPSVEIRSEKVSHRVIPLGDSFNYTLQDIRRAAFTGRGLEARKAIAARRVYERSLDAIAAFGAPDDGIADGIANKTVGTGTGQIRSTAATATAWDGSPDALVMVADANKAVSEMVSDSKETQVPKILVLPTLQYLRFRNTYTADNKPESAYDRFLSSNGFVDTVIPWDLLKSVDGTGGNYSRGLLMRKDPDVLELVIPQEFEVFAPQQDGLLWKVLCHGRTAGTCVYKTLGLRYLTGLPDT